MSTEPDLSMSRRRLLSGVAAAGVAVPLLAACGGESTEQSNQGSGSGQDNGSGEGNGQGDGYGQGGGSDDEGNGSGGGTELAKTSDIPVGGGKVFADQKVVVTQPTEGDIQAFADSCTHKGCPMEPKITGEQISCSKSCGHGSMFNLDGTVANGPATKPLSAAKVTVEGDSIMLA